MVNIKAIVKSLWNRGVVWGNNNGDKVPTLYMLPQFISALNNPVCTALLYNYGLSVMRRFEAMEVVGERNSRLHRSSYSEYRLYLQKMCYASHMSNRYHQFLSQLFLKRMSIYNVVTRDFNSYAERQFKLREIPLSIAFEQHRMYRAQKKLKAISVKLYKCTDDKKKQLLEKQYDDWCDKFEQSLHIVTQQKEETGICCVLGDSKWWWDTEGRSSWGCAPEVTNNGQT